MTTGQAHSPYSAHNVPQGTANRTPLQAEKAAEHLETLAKRWTKLARTMPPRTVTDRGVPRTLVHIETREDLLGYAESARQVAQDIRANA